MTPSAGRAEVRRVGPDDWLLWREVRQRSLREEPDAFAATAHQWLDQWDQEPMWRGRLVAVRSFVATVDGEPVGTAGLDVAEGELISMWVAVAHRRQGVGRLLVDAVLAEATGPVSLRVMADNALAVTFYEERGFVLTSAPVDAEGCVSMVRPADG